MFRMIIPEQVAHDNSSPAKEKLRQQRVVTDSVPEPAPESKSRSVDSLFKLVAEEFSLQPEILEAVAEHESGRNPWALNIEGRSFYPVSRDEALMIIEKNKEKSFDVGLMQVNSYWIRKYGLSIPEVLEPDGNVRLGAWILRYCLDEYGYNWRAIGAYHTGSPDNMPQRSRAYAVKVMEKFKYLLNKSREAKK